MKKRIMSMMLILILLSTLSLFVGAKEAIDFESSGSITVTMEYRSRPISGGTLTIYRVADLVRTDGTDSFVYTEDFAECEIPLDDIDSADLADALADIAENRNRDGISCKLNDNGKAVFPNLELGLYLVVQTKSSPGFYRINPFLVSVPMYENGAYVYDVDTEPKNLPTPKPDETEPPETDPPETEPEETRPPETEPEETKPRETEPVETKPVETEPVETEPKETEPVETEPVETEPVEREPIETEPVETEPIEPPKDEEELPQTGLINWPIPVLAAAGMIFIVVGLCLRAAGKKSYEE